MGTPRLLIVDDDPPAREAKRSLFTHGDCQVETASSLAEAFEALDPPPDCLILDVDLPGVDGVEVLHRVGSTGLPIRIAVCTGTTDQEHLTAVAGVNPRALLGRPLDVEALTKALGFPPV